MSSRIVPRIIFVFVEVLALAGCAGFGPHRDLVVQDRAARVQGRIEAPLRGVRITYLGTNSFLIQAADTAVLVDPYFTRCSLLSISLNAPIEPNAERIDRALSRLPERIDLILVTHGHFDHLLDVPSIAGRSGALVVASRTSCLLAQAAGTPSQRTLTVRPGQRRNLESARVTVLAAAHDRVFGCVPFPGRLEVIADPPTRPSQWVVGQPLAFVLELDGKRIYIDSGGTRQVLPPQDAGPVDLAILGATVSDSRDRLPEALARLRPQFVLLSHQDDFFRPLSDGFH